MVTNSNVKHVMVIEEIVTDDNVIELNLNFYSQLSNTQ